MYYNFEKGEISEGSAPVPRMNISATTQKEIEASVERIAAEMVMEEIFGPDWKKITNITRPVGEKNEVKK